MKESQVTTAASVHNPSGSESNEKGQSAVAVEPEYNKKIRVENYLLYADKDEIVRIDHLLEVSRDRYGKKINPNDFSSIWMELFDEILDQAEKFPETPNKELSGPEISEAIKSKIAQLSVPYRT
jgi:hypothetical protein